MTNEVNIKSIKDLGIESACKFILFASMVFNVVADKEVKKNVDNLYFS